MECPNHITDHKKFKHLTYEDYMVIELRPKGSWKPNAITQKELHCAANTVRNIIKRGDGHRCTMARFSASKAKIVWKA